MTPSPPSSLPRATYRLQITREFGFDAARALLPYLARLGISHVYLSPCLQATPGSTHGYDVLDPGRIDEERGGEAAFERLLAAAREQGLGVVLDIVPNHVAANEQNPWWRDVLTHGRQSRYAEHFDVDWQVDDPELRGRVLLPILGAPLGEVLAEGHVRVVDADGGDAGERRPRLGVYDRDLPLCPDSIARGLHRQDDLRPLLRAQHYVLAFWREGLQRLNWRRFFDVSELVGVRVEHEPVFLDVHARALDLVQRGLVQGLRVDHPDGLRDPAGYAQRLRRAAPDAWLVVEKILEPGEALPPWPVHGTTGYDFLAAASGLFVDRDGEHRLCEIVREITGSCPPFERLRRDKKTLAIRELFVAETERAAALLGGVLGSAAPSPDVLRRAIEAMAVSMPVYRTYVPEHGKATAQDRHWLEEARDRAARDEPRPDADVLQRLVAVLSGDDPGGFAGPELRARFQQLTGPAMAKGLEDTALYCDRRLASLNEVGGDPTRFGTSREQFHELCEALQDDWPFTMTALSTHDTKRSADVRLRIATLSEVADRWAGEVWHWRELAMRHRPARDLPLPGAEYLLFQTLVGCWPAEPDRIVDYLRKAAREAKLRTSWLDPDPEYERSLETFARALLDDRELTARIDAFVGTIVPAARVHGLGLLLLHLTAVGVPDVYQGCEVVRESLTDPDNRRPVDFERRRALLARVEDMGAGEALATGDDAARLWLLHRVLGLRRTRAASFGADAPHVPLPITGEGERHAIAYARGDDLAVVVPRFLLRAQRRAPKFRVALPGDGWRSAWDGSKVGAEPDGDTLFAHFPVALLVRG